MLPVSTKQDKSKTAS